jgi:cob(I)alamin adenosyltransferase
MALFTGKGDDGKTKTFGCDQRISKSSATAEALGAMDEANSFLGLVKVQSKEIEEKVNLNGGIKMMILERSFEKIIGDVQQNLFIIQAEVAGSKMTITEDKLKECELYINEAEKILPPIKTFFVSGGTEIAALCDFSRTLIRKAERRVVSIVDNDGQDSVGKVTLAYLNRLSSLLYVLARLSNHFCGIVEDAPSYK